ncbi:MAG TPA: ABC transporter substrate-binding protein [Chloroflexota bacterium]|nr:ABC transporter substrate-binding protein [Chloroflexota bacterium]
MAFRTWLRGAVGSLLAALWLAAACGPSAASTPTRPAAAPAEQAAGAVAPAGAPAAAAAPARPELATSPPVTVKVGYLPVASWAPLFLAQDRGYFTEVGLEVESAPFGNYATQVPLLAQGQLHVAGCANAVICYNAFGRGLDIRIVTDLSSAGQTEKSRGSSALVVRKDLWDNGTIREARDLVGRTLYTQAGPGSGQQAWAGHWLIRNGVDPAAMDWTQLQFPDLFAAMQNRAAEVGFQSEPFVTAGLTRGVHAILATAEQMEPGLQQTYVMYWTGIDGLGPQVGERFMVAWLRAGRDFLNAMEYGTDQDAVIEVLTRETGIKDPEVHRQSKYAWHNPNGEVNREALQADADFFAELGLMAQMDISPSFDDKYRQFAVQYLGEYQPPQ